MTYGPGHIHRPTPLNQNGNVIPGTRQDSAYFRTGSGTHHRRNNNRLVHDYSFPYSETTWYEPSLTPTFTATYVPSTRNHSSIWSSGGLGTIITISFVALAIFAFFPLLLI